MGGGESGECAVVGCDVAEEAADGGSTPPSRYVRQALMPERQTLVPEWKRAVMPT